MYISLFSVKSIYLQSSMGLISVRPLKILCKLFCAVFVTCKVVGIFSTHRNVFKKIFSRFVFHLQKIIKKSKPLFIYIEITNTSIDRTIFFYIFWCHLSCRLLNRLICILLVFIWLCF